jgi:hypothetical protein
MSYPDAPNLQSLSLTSSESRSSSLLSFMAISPSLLALRAGTATQDLPRGGAPGRSETGGLESEDVGAQAAACASAEGVWRPTIAGAS